MGTDLVSRTSSAQKWVEPFQTYSSNNVTSMSRQPIRLVLSEPQRPWTEAVKNRLDELGRLPVGWDGYGGQPVSFSVANFALIILNGVCAAEANAPHIVPGTRGDIQLEWHTAEGDIELHITAPYRVHAWRKIARVDDDGEELNLSTDFTVVRNWLREFAEMALAAKAAAA